MINFLEKTFKIKFNNKDIVERNFLSVNKITETIIKTMNK